MTRDEHILLFGLAAQMAERQLDAIESRIDVNLARSDRGALAEDATYYPQFKERFRHEAAEMAQYYELFYCLERSIRDLIQALLAADNTVDWWDAKVPQPIRLNVDANIKKERQQGVTARSSEKIDYTTFGELGEIVRANWQVFSDTFNDEKAFSRVMTSLNVLRGPIAHCCPLAEDEQVRLRLTVRDWFRLME